MLCISTLELELYIQHHHLRLWVWCQLLPFILPPPILPLLFWPYAICMATVVGLLCWPAMFFCAHCAHFTSWGRAHCDSLWPRFTVSIIMHTLFNGSREMNKAATIMLEWKKNTFLSIVNFSLCFHACYLMMIIFFFTLFWTCHDAVVSQQAYGVEAWTWGSYCRSCVCLCVFFIKYEQ